MQWLTSTLILNLTLNCKYLLLKTSHTRISLVKLEITILVILGIGWVSRKPIMGCKELMAIFYDQLQCWILIMNIDDSSFCMQKIISLLACHVSRQTVCLKVDFWTNLNRTVVVFIVCWSCVPVNWWMFHSTVIFWLNLLLSDYFNTWHGLSLHTPCRLVFHYNSHFFFTVCLN